MALPSPTTPLQPSAADEVVLLDDHGRPAGRADRMTVHTTATPLHLAFSTYLFNAKGQVLVTRRALSKKAWPGVWTNSCCGHPKPGENIEDAARRRIREELGLHVGPVVPLLPNFRYRAVDASGIVENEVCPVFAAFVGDEDPIANPAEVSEWAWVEWPNLLSAVLATPHVYSPWMVMQIPAIGDAFPGAMPEAVGHNATQHTDVSAALREVDDLLTAELTALASEWAGYVDGFGVDILAEDLPKWLGTLVQGGKRLRVAMAYWGFTAAGGAHGTPSYRHLIRASAALEMLHLFALIHDDVMDESDSRRGRPSAHVQAATWHQDSDGVGNKDVFGRNLAILLGDLAHTVADRLIDGLPRPLREAWYQLSVELIAGQRSDLTGAAASRWDRGHAEHVARLKSGRYTVMRPLQFGAIAAGASREAEEALLTCGELLGRAFALRDDYLGVWGDPTVTGKPAGDDLFEAKATVLLSIARDRLTGSAAETLNTLGTAAFTRRDVAALAAAMREAGVDAELERLINDDVTAGLACLDAVGLVPAGIDGLRDAAHAAAWRDA